MPNRASFVRYTNRRADGAGRIVMSLSALMLLALGISVDNFAVSLGIGTANPVRRVKEHVRLAIVFGVFQFFMPLLGWLGGSQIIFLSHGYESRFLCAALAFVGWCMLHSSKESNQIKHIDLSSLSPVLSLAFATSVDSLAVGFGLAMVRVNIRASQWGYRRGHRVPLACRDAIRWTVGACAG
jgi:manganese efflux pump family protein